ncbi:MAG: hypothetical protein ACF8Q5_00280, partial [Phycisphaerales bacterium JB040]
GGVLESSYAPGSMSPTIADTRSTSGSPPARWFDSSNPTISSSVKIAQGFFWPAQAPNPPEADTHTSGWEILAPASRLAGDDPLRPLVLVIAFHESDEGGKIEPNYTKPYPYVAGTNAVGLSAPAFPVPMDSYVAEALTKPYDLVMAYAMMPHGPRPYPMTLQRGLELVEFVKELFRLEIPGEQSFDLVIAAGSSHGCGNAMLAPTLFPEVFHGGVGYGHPPDFTQPMFSHEFQRWTSAHLGYGGIEAFSIYDALGLAFVEKYTGANPAGLSVPARFRAQQTAGGPAAFLQRPLYLLTGDEDPTDAGEDWMSLLGVSGPQGSLALQTIQVPNAHPSVKLFLSRADKTCHGTEVAIFADPYTDPPSQTSNIRLPVYYLIEHLIANPPPAAQPVDHPTENLANSLLRPYDGIFGEHVPTAGLQTTYPSGFNLEEMAGWPSFQGSPHGHAGTRLGEGDALQIYSPPGGGTFVYVGSAEGVVSRFQLDASDRFELVDQSPDLGYGAWAMDIGELGAGGPCVAVATAMGLHLLDATDLTNVLHSVPLPDRKEFRPRRLQLADLDLDGTKEIVFATTGGRLAVYDSSLSRVAWLDEPGIVDFEVGPPGAGIPAGISISSETYKRPIYLASLRGHIVSVLLQDPGSGPQAYLLAASPGETGRRPT